MSRHRLSQTDLLRLARDALVNAIGVHPCPREYPFEIDGYERDLAEVERRLKIAETKQARAAAARGTP